MDLLVTRRIGAVFVETTIAERNVRAWAETCNAHPELTESLLSKLRKHPA